MIYLTLKWLKVLLEWVKLIILPTPASSALYLSHSVSRSNPGHFAPDWDRFNIVCPQFRKIRLHLPNKAETGVQEQL